jgi:hypothetical protein
MIDSEGIEIRRVETKEFTLERLIGKFECIPGPGACIRREFIEGGILRDPRYSLVSDYECWQRLSLKGEFLRVPEFLAFWRLHGENASVTSRGAAWAHQVIDLANSFFNGVEAKSNKKVRTLAQRGMSKAYTLGALQGAWDPTVPSLYYFGKSFRHGIVSGRKIEIEDLAIVAQVIYSKLTRIRDKYFRK